MLEMNNVEKAIIELLKKGYSQNEIAENFKETKNFSIYSKSSIEKIIHSLKKRHQVKTIFQLGMVVDKFCTENASKS
jgi:transcriptional regulator